MYYVYLIKSLRNGRYYVGFTSDLRRRIKEHNSKQSKATSRYVPYEIVYYEDYKDVKDAKDRESKLKYHGQGIRILKERLRYSVK